MTWPPGSNELAVGPDGDEVRVKVWYEGRRIVDFSIQLLALIDGEHWPVARYDCSHGSAPHRDILDWDGKTIRKTYMREGISYDDAFNEALDELLENWPRYIRDFRWRRP